MAAELGKLAELARKDRDFYSSSQFLNVAGNFLLDDEQIPLSLDPIPQPDTLISLAKRLKEQKFERGASLILALNKFLNDTGIFTDEKQAELVAKAKKAA
ncbi:MAG: hypothetical protein A2798_03700 [Candidatus Levybacteria bacterium RIFCSPHIGHO2_01_FULL_37_17]|nr:MAG: hypothetical protein A2798_03700 [Candidatus Levybacteria bacterium RIFCSPHIGHO2_01_FULL_37_17]OGH36577.1 MAG: hypothetical protein A2959_03755 [Candidatus Levybacteria bacterium RIFCSPLOWO2_01_FULL_38_23]